MCIRDSRKQVQSKLDVPRGRSVLRRMKTARGEVEFDLDEQFRRRKRSCGCVECGGDGGRVTLVEAAPSRRKNDLRTDEIIMQTFRHALLGFRNRRRTTLVIPRPRPEHIQRGATKKTLLLRSGSFHQQPFVQSALLPPPKAPLILSTLRPSGPTEPISAPLPPSRPRSPPQAAFHIPQTTKNLHKRHAQVPSSGFTFAPVINKMSPQRLQTVLGGPRDDSRKSTKRSFDLLPLQTSVGTSLPQISRDTTLRKSSHAASHNTSKVLSVAASRKKLEETKFAQTHFGVYIKELKRMRRRVNVSSTK
eukprot:TRINITY_DN15411_c0_g1_i1.p1 TRINITY_DN15411_c0_g1~~TRINITY_DN15411_c0_g1_i1.p1  ORF type:complete len:305 (+),score=36.61 TRINITY_DN15411_c0_g1_i1:64-978(+)